MFVPVSSLDMVFQPYILFSLFMFNEFRGGFLFCWYWWNCWPSLFNISFHTTHISYLNTCVTKLTFASKFWKIKLRSRSKVRTSSWMCASSFFLLPLLTCKDSRFNLECVCFICSIIFSAKPTEKGSRF